MHLHLCDEDGISMHETDCVSHTQKSDCCQAPAPETDDDCCQDLILYGITPKFGSVSVEKLQQQLFFSFYMHHFDMAPAALSSAATRYQYFQPFSLYNRDILISQGVLII